MMTHLDWSSIAPRVGHALLHFLWQGLLVYAVWAALLPLMRRATTRYAFSLLALAALAICPVYTFMDWAPVEAETAGHATFIEGLEANVRQLASNWGWQAYVVAVWSVGVLLMSFKLMLGYAGLVQLRRGLAPLSTSLLPGAGGWREGLRRRVEGRLFATDRVREAVVVGFCRPMILIPTSWLAEMPAEMLEAVIAHEVAHIRRFDLWVNLLQRLLETVLFYHPVVWLISKRARWERELCCDEMAVATTGERLTYVDALSWVASRSVVANRPVLSAAILGDRKMRLLARVKNVLQMNESGERTTWWAAAVLAMALPLTAWVVAGAQERDKERDKEREKREDRIAEHRERDRHRDEDRAATRRDRERNERTEKVRREHRERDELARRDRDARGHDARDRDARDRDARDRDGARRVEIRRRVEHQHRDRDRADRDEHARRDEHSARAKHAREHDESDQAHRLGLEQIQRRIHELTRGLDQERARYEKTVREYRERALKAEDAKRHQEASRTLRAPIVRRDEHAGGHAESHSRVHQDSNQELVRLVSDLKREVQQLRREVHALRNQHGRGHEGHDSRGRESVRREAIHRGPAGPELRLIRPAPEKSGKNQPARRGTIHILRGNKPEVERRVIESRLEGAPRKSESTEPRSLNQSRRRIIRREEAGPKQTFEFKGFKLNLDPASPARKKIHVETLERGAKGSQESRPQTAIIQVEVEESRDGEKKDAARARISETVLNLVKKKLEGKDESRLEKVPERRLEKKEVRVEKKKVEKKEGKPQPEKPQP